MRLSMIWQLKMMIMNGLMNSCILILLVVLSGIGRADTEVECLASNIYHEARNQPLVGQLAIAFVTYNRVKDDSEFRSYNTYCDVIRQGYRRGSKSCHFSWYCDGVPDTPYEVEKYQEILDFSKWFIDNVDYVVDPTK